MSLHSTWWLVAPDSSLALNIRISAVIRIGWCTCPFGSVIAYLSCPFSAFVCTAALWAWARFHRLYMAVMQVESSSNSITSGMSVFAVEAWCAPGSSPQASREWRQRLGWIGEIISGLWHFDDTVVIGERKRKDSVSGFCAARTVGRISWT